MDGAWRVFGLILDWLADLVPDKPGEWWTAFGALATATIAWLAKRIAWRQFVVEDTPILMVRQEGGGPVVDNVGRGVALRIYVCDDAGCVVHAMASIPAGKREVLTNVHLDMHSAYFLYYQSITGRWFCSKAVGQSISGGGSNFPVSVSFDPVRHRRLPTAVRKAIRLVPQSLGEYLSAILSPFTRQGSELRRRERFKRIRLRAVSLWWSIGERRRLRKFRSKIRPDLGAPARSDTTEWPLVIRGEASCWHTTSMWIAQRGCQVDESGFVFSQIEVQRLHGRVLGVVVVYPNAWRRFQDMSATDRTEQAFASLQRYLCGRRPQSEFVHVIKG